MTLAPEAPKPFVYNGLGDFERSESSQTFKKIDFFVFFVVFDKKLLNTLLFLHFLLFFNRKHLK